MKLSAIALLTALAASAVELPPECASLQVLSTVVSDFALLPTAERCAAQPGLDSVRRADLLLKLGQLRRGLGDAAGAEKAFRRAAAERPADPVVLATLAEALRDRPEEALPYALKAGAARLAGEIQADLGDPAAGATLERALKDDPADLLALRALARVRPADVRKTAARAVEAAAAAPAWCRAAAFRLAAQIQLDAGLPAEGLKAAARALESDPYDIDALELMAAARRRSPSAVVPALPPPSDAVPPGPELRDAAAVDAFTAAIASLPQWQRYDAYRVVVSRWVELGDKAKADLLLQRLNGRDYQTVSALRLYHRIHGKGLHGVNGEFVRVRLSADLRDQLGDAAGAEAVLAAALERFKGAPEPLQSMAEFQLAHGRPEKALEAARRVQPSLDRISDEELFLTFQNDTFLPDLKDPRLKERLRMERDRRSRAALEVIARAEAAAGRDKQAEAAYQRALDMSPRDAGALMNLVEFELKRGRADQAMVCAKRLEASSVKGMAFERVEAHRTLAKVRAANKDSVGAERELERALEAVPADAGALRDLIELRSGAGKTREALAAAETLVAAVSGPAERADAYTRVAALKRTLGDAAGELSALESALQASPADTVALRAMIEARLSAGDAAAARAYGERLLAASPGDLNALWQVFDSMGARPKDALALLEEHKPQGEKAEWRAMRALAKARLGEPAGPDMDAALRADSKAACFSQLFLNARARLHPAYFDACIGAFPRDASLYLDRGVARYQAGEKTAALPDFEKAIDLKADYAEAYLSLATALVNEGRREQALAVADRGLARVAKDAPVSGLLASMREDLRSTK